MNRFDIYSKRLIWSGAFLLTAFVAGCGGGGGGGGAVGAKAGPAHYNLGAAAPFGAGSGGGVHNQGTLTVVTGDLGTSNAPTTITGLRDTTTGPYTVTAANDGNVTGTIFTSNTPAGDAPATANAVVVALTQAYSDLGPTGAVGAGGTEPNSTTPGELGGLTLAPGVYLSSSLQITGADLTLDAKGNPNAFWILQSGSTLTVGESATPRNVILAGGALAKNVYWWVGTSATINSAGGGTMEGTIISSQLINISSAGKTTPTTLNGRAFVFGSAAVNMVNTVITTPAP
jgi:hypothetical protein